MGASSELIPVVIRHQKKKKPPFGWLLFASIALLMGALTFSEVVEWENGTPKLKKKRQEQLQKQLNELEDAEQYVLVARRSGLYPCLSCPAPIIYLNAGEVWKYGVTRKGKEGRYTEQYLGANGLIYFVEFRGALQQCLAVEKQKIFNYPLLPENLARPDVYKLAKPPGNLRTD